jgi:hypothetical protein
MKKPQIQTFRIAIIGSGQLIGEEDIIKDTPEGEKKYYTTSVRCISTKPAYVFCIKYDEFLRKFRNNKDSWNCIMKIANEKEKTMKKRYNLICGQLQTLAEE